MPTANPALDQLSVNTIRALAIDTVLKANSGHPGLPLDAAPMAYALWTRAMKHNPSDPEWADRDRFVLSAGHGSAMLYSLLHLTGYRPAARRAEAVPAVGQPHAGAPRVRRDARRRGDDGAARPGASANAVGWRSPSVTWRPASTGPGHEIVDHRTYVIAGDGDLMEGVAHEAASLAGHLRPRQARLLLRLEPRLPRGLRRTCRSPTTSAGCSRATAGTSRRSRTATTSTRSRARPRRPGRSPSKPSLVIVHTQIGYGSPKQGTFGVHGSPLNAEQVVETKKTLGYPSLEPFFIAAQGPREPARLRGPRAQAAQAEWQVRFDAYRKAHRDLAAEFERVMKAQLPAGWDRARPDLRHDREADRDPRGRRQGAERDRRARAGDGRRLGRPQSLDRDGAQGRAATSSRQSLTGGDQPGRGRRRVGLRRPQPPVRRARARDGRGLQRPRAPRRPDPVLRDLLHLLRLHAAVDPAGVRS